MKRLRCSSLPMFFACPHSQDATDMAIEAANEGAPLGTAAHDTMVSITSGLDVDIRLVALRHGVPVDDLGPLVWFGRKAWEELRASFPNPRHEVPVGVKTDFGELTGHIDLLSEPVTHKARIIDWKSGRKDTNYYDQVAGYATCLILCGYTEVIVSTVWLRFQEIETFKFTRVDVDHFLARLRQRLSVSTYQHGEHCTYCVRSHNCEALVALGKRDVALFASTQVESAVDTATPVDLVSIRRRAKMLTTFSESLDRAIRRRVEKSGPLDSGDGYALSLVEENGRRAVDALKAWPVLQDRLTDEELASCVTVSAKSAEDIVASKVGRGFGAAARRKLAADLETAGAISQTTVTKLKEVRTALPLPKENSNGK